MGAPNPLLTQAELDAYGEVLRESLPDAAVITDVSRSNAPSSTGGMAETFTDRTPAVDARLSPLSGLTRGESVLVGKLTIEDQLVLTLPRGTPLDNRDLVTVHKLDDDGSVLDTIPVAVALVMGRTSYEVAVRAVVTRLTD